MEIQQISHKNNIPVLKVTNTDLSPSEISFTFDGSEDQMTPYLEVYNQGDLVDSYEVDSVVMQFLRFLRDSHQYIVQVDDVTAQNDVLQTTTDISSLYKWAESAV